jgi:uncharacterized phiE125 gp8 family phage protein
VNARRKLVTGPSPELLTPGDIYAHIRVEYDAEDPTYLIALAQAARAWVEDRAWLAVGPQVWETYLDAFPEGPVELAPGPLLEVVEVQYIDPNGSTQTLANTEYRTDAVSLPGRVVPVASWPGTQDQRENAVRIRYRVGYTTDTVPPQLMHAMRLLVGHFHENRESIIIARASEQPYEVPMAAHALVDQIAMRRVL